MSKLRSSLRLHGHRPTRGRAAERRRLSHFNSRTFPILYSTVGSRELLRSESRTRAPAVRGQMSDNFPTFLRFARFVSRTAHVWLLLLASVTSSAALLASAWFLRRFDGSWPEMFRENSARALFQATILAPICFALASSVISLVRQKGAIARLAICVFAVAAVAADIAIASVDIDLGPRQWDVGMGVTYNWSPSVVLLQLFMTPYGGYATAFVVFVGSAIITVRAIFRRE